ncbi:hypothetical protein D3C85_491480 [compost metagenome]
MAFKQGTSVLEVLFGVDFGCCDSVEGFVEDGDDAMLFCARGHAGIKSLGLGEVDRLMNRAAGKAKKICAFGQQ